MKTYLHPSNEILIGIGDTGLIFAGFREARSNGIRCVMINASLEDIERVSDGWYDDDAETSDMQDTRNQMEWIDNRIVEGITPGRFVAEAKKYIALNSAA